MPETKTVYLKATYTSPTHPEPQLISSTALSQPKEMTVTSKTSYLSSLRAATIALQETINVTLTARMEEDAARAQAQGTSTDQGAEAAGRNNKDADEAAEEENYGEEIPEDDD
ncbi:hypothetical protein F4859DRAFT_336645 [Xylaria cf. heliscus]|nr:hypothetical protein F4859DRAFT_336645 [Xylaria cf. heliscus]